MSVFILLICFRGEDWELWLEFVFTAIKAGQNNPLEHATMAINKKKLFDWKVSTSRI